MPIKGAKRHSARLKKIRSVRPTVAQIVFAAADELAAEAALSITAGSVSGAGHVPSKPYDPPNADTLVLSRSIHVEQKSKKRLSAKVVADAPYAVELEYGTSRMIERPYMRPATMRVRPRMSQAIAKMIDQAKKL